jgi:SulP family sulfate permease
MGPRVEADWRKAAGPVHPTVFAPTLDDVLLYVEEAILAHPEPGGAMAAPSFLDEVRAATVGGDLDALLERIELTEGTELIAEGAVSRDIYVLESGILRAEVARQDGSRLVVARFLPGAVIGEIAFYAGLPRTAAVIADTAARLTRIDAVRLGAGDAQLAAAFHRAVATRLAQRLTRTTQLVRHASL